MKRLQILGVLVVCLAACKMDHFRVYKMDHFLVYDVEEQKIEQESVLLKGQFDDQWKKAVVMSLNYLANPVEKSHQEHRGKIYDENRHFTWYRIRQPDTEPRRTVRFKNQFGIHSVDIRTPLFLLVPAQKRSHPNSKFPRGLDHYKAYSVIRVNSAPTPLVVELKDQFVARTGHVTRVALFCVPVSKRRGNEHTEIKNEKNHFAAYALTAGDFRGHAKTFDQFLDVGLNVGATRVLMVPSEKLGFQTHDK